MRYVKVRVQETIQHEVDEVMNLPTSTVQVVEVSYDGETVEPINPAQMTLLRFLRKLRRANKGTDIVWDVYVFGGLNTREFTMWPNGSVTPLTEII